MKLFFQKQFVFSLSMPPQKKALLKTSQRRKSPILIDKDPTQRGRKAPSNKLQKVKKILQGSYSEDAQLPTGVTRDNSLSGKRVSVYNDSTTGKTYVAHRGTHSLKDWVTDFAMALGYEGGRRFQHSRNIQKQAEAKYGSKNVITVGHSLGGRIAEKMGKKSSEIITYNKATTPRSIIETLIKPLPKKQTDIRTRSDLVSIGTKLQRRAKDIIKLNKPHLNPITEHSLDAIK